MAYETIIYEKKGNVGVVTFNRPNALNAMNTQVMHELVDVLDVMDKDTDIHCVVFTGSGKKAFMAGADIKEEDGNTPKMHRAFLNFGHGLMDKVENFRTPTIAAINGYALGGGLEIAMACDLRFASDNAKMGVPEVNLGVIPGWGGTHRLPALVGLARAKEMVMTGRHVPANQAYEYGLVQEVYPQDELMDKVMEFANDVASKAPMSTEFGKIAVTAGFWSDPKTSSETEKDIHCQLFVTWDKDEAHKAFIEKRPHKPFRGE